MKPPSAREQLKKARKRRFKTMYDRIPFLQDLSYSERTWWIRYYKLKTCWKNNFPNLEFYPDEHIPNIHHDKHYFEFNYKTTQYDSDNVFERVEPLPWDKPNPKSGVLGVNHDVNIDLLDIEMLFKALEYDWEHIKLEEISFPVVVDCNFDGVSCTCQDCRYRFKCELRGE